MMNDLRKIGDKYIFHSTNGMDYYVKIINVSEYREPDRKYGLDIYDENGVYAGDIMFFGDYFLDKCEKI